MPRDYKNTPRSKPKRNRRKQKKATVPGWIWIVVILAVGIVIGLVGPRLLGIAQHQLKEITPPAQVHTKPPAKDENTAKTSPEKPRFDFYKMLPKFQVVVPKEDKEVKSDSGKKPVKKPGAYVLQVASFQDYHQADAMKARLALLGLEAHIQKIKTNNGETWNRVRIGPIKNLDKLNKARKALSGQRIKPLLIQVNK
jgi:cell division protein FtsN